MLHTKERVLEEIEKIKLIVSKGFVLYDLLNLYLDYQLNEYLDEFFDKVDKGEYRIIGIQQSYIYFQKMMHLLHKKDYKKYFSLYENLDKTKIDDNHRILLKINYYNFKRNLDKLAEAHYEYYEFTKNQNELLTAVQIKIQADRIFDAEAYLNMLNPNEIDEPEMYYVFKAIILTEQKELSKAFQELDYAKSNYEIDIESQFHQFYSGFCMSNNRVDEAVKYMAEYYSKNPNVSWFKIIRHSENESGEVLVEKLMEAAGGKRDLSHINYAFSRGELGIAVYSKLTNTSMEIIINSNQYPYTRINISQGNTAENKVKTEVIGDKIILDSTTLKLLIACKSISLLEVFKEILLPYSTVEILLNEKNGFLCEYATNALEFIRTSPLVRRMAVDESIRTNDKETDMFFEDVQDCISLAKEYNSVYLNTEILVDKKYNLPQIINVNILFAYLKKNYPTKSEEVAHTIANMREKGLEFISFDANDMCYVYNTKGDEIKNAFLKMGVFAEYKTFSVVYTSFLEIIYNTKSIDQFEKISRDIICFMDKYVSKTRHYLYRIMKQYSPDDAKLTQLIRKPSVKGIMRFTSSIYIQNSIVKDVNIIETIDFKKINNICTAFIIFVMRYLMIFNKNKDIEEEQINFLKSNLTINDGEDIDYIVRYIKQVKDENIDKEK